MELKISTKKGTLISRYKRDREKRPGFDISLYRKGMQIQPVCTVDYEPCTDSICVRVFADETAESSRVEPTHFIPVRPSNNVVGKKQGMTIWRVIDGKPVEIELTHEELGDAYNCYEHYIDCEYVRNRLNSGCHEEFEELTDEEFEQAVHQIAYEKRECQDQYLCDEDCALDNAVACYIRTHLSSAQTKTGGSMYVSAND